MKRAITLSAIFFSVVFLIASTVHAGKNIVPNHSFEAYSGSAVHDIASIDYGYGGGIAELYKGDSYSGGKCILLEATGMDYSRVYTDAKPNNKFSDIVDFGFWFKHDGDPNLYNDLTPYIVIVVDIEGGDYDGGELVAIQWNTWDQGYETDWTWFNNDEWHYQVYDADGNFVDNGWGNFPLARIQSLYDGTIERVAVAIGLAGGDESARVLVDHLVVEVD